MMTFTPPHLTPRARPVPRALASRRRAARASAASVLAVSLAALGACSSEAPLTQNPPAAGSTAPTDPPSGTGTVTGTGAPSTPGSPSTSTAAATTPGPPTAPARSDKKTDVSIKDSTLGHDITVTKVSRNVPWPAGNPVASKAFEIVGVEMTVDAGDRYTATVAPSMFTLRSASSPVQVKPTGEFGSKLGSPLATAERSKKKSGWLFFKLDRGAKGALTLTFNRPAYKVSTTGKDIPADTFSKAIG